MQLLREYINLYAAKTEAAKALGIVPAHLSKILSSERPVSRQLHERMLSTWRDRWRKNYFAAILLYARAAWLTHELLTTWSAQAEESWTKAQVDLTDGENSPDAWALRDWTRYDYDHDLSNVGPDSIVVTDGVVVSAPVALSKIVAGKIVLLGGTE